MKCINNYNLSSFHINMQSTEIQNLVPISEEEENYIATECYAATSHKRQRMDEQPPVDMDEDIHVHASADDTLHQQPTYVHQDSTPMDDNPHDQFEQVGPSYTSFDVS